MTNERIQEWWLRNFQNQELVSVRPVSGSLSRNNIFLLNEQYILKIYNEVSSRFNKEVKTLKQLDSANIAPKLYAKKRRDPIFGANASLMSYVGHANLLQLIYLMGEREKAAMASKIANALRTLHSHKNIQLVQQSSVLTKETAKLLKKPRVLQNTPKQIIEFSHSFLNSLPEVDIIDTGVIAHLDFNLANYVINGENLNLIDFEYAKLDFRWKELQTIIKFCLTASDDLRDKYDFLETRYPNGFLKNLIFDIRNEYPEMFSKSQRVWIETILLNQILGKFNRPTEPKLDEYIRSSVYLFNQIFRTSFLDELLV
jgi:serine/threonine protein kinase